MIRLESGGEKVGVAAAEFQIFCSVFPLFKSTAAFSLFFSRNSTSLKWRKQEMNINFFCIWVPSNVSI